MLGFPAIVGNPLFDGMVVVFVTIWLVSLGNVLLVSVWVRRRLFCLCGIRVRFLCWCRFQMGRLGCPGRVRVCVFRHGVLRGPGVGSRWDEGDAALGSR